MDGRMSVRDDIIPQQTDTVCIHVYCKVAAATARCIPSIP